MAGINATVTTDSLINDETPVVNKKKKAEEKVNLDVCHFCQKKLTAFVVADGKKFCSDDHVKQYLS